MNQIITIRTDAKTKRAAQGLAKEAGLTLNSLVNSYLKQVVINRRIEICLPEKMTPKLEKMIGQAEADIKTGKNLSRKHNNAADFIKDLKSNDTDFS